MSTFTVPFQESWFARDTKHHVRVPPSLVYAVEKWVRDHGLAYKNSTQVEIFADGKFAGNGALHFTSGHLTGIKKMFGIMSIAQTDPAKPALLARLHFSPSSPQISFGRLYKGDVLIEDGQVRSSLLPFSEKSEDSYVVDLEASLEKRSKNHERLVNGFARWMTAIGYTPRYSRAIDLALLRPPLIVEAKFINPGKWTECIRGAVAQLQEYRWFYADLHDANLLFLASMPVPEHWRGYLTECHGIRSAWPDGDSYHVEDLDALLPPISLQTISSRAIIDSQDDEEEGS